MPFSIRGLRNIRSATAYESKRGSVYASTFEIQRSDAGKRAGNKSNALMEQTINECRYLTIREKAIERAGEAFTHGRGKRVSPNDRRR